MFGLMLSVTGFVVGQEASQNTTAVISSNLSVVINPTTINFGPILPGESKILDDAITFNAGMGSNENISIGVTDVTGIFKNNIKVSIANNVTFVPLESFTNVLGCVVQSNVCTYTPIVLDAILKVPAGTPAGTQSGIITYTITGQHP